MTLSLWREAFDGLKVCREPVEFSNPKTDLWSCVPATCRASVSQSCEAHGGTQPSKSFCNTPWLWRAPLRKLHASGTAVTPPATYRASVPVLRSPWRYATFKKFLQGTANMEGRPYESCTQATLQSPLLQLSDGSPCITMQIDVVCRCRIYGRSGGAAACVSLQSEGSISRPGECMCC
jgi:hypothetical protein